MSVNNTLQLVQESGWHSGFANFLRKENGIWWRTRKWWVQSLVWFFILNGLVVLFLWVIPLDDPSGAPTTREAYAMFFQLLPVAALGVLIRPVLNLRDLDPDSVRRHLMPAAKRVLEPLHPAGPSDAA